MTILSTTIILFVIILITGGLTTFTDLTIKKIYNHHIIISAIIGLVTIAYAALFKHENVLFHFINGLIAFIIGFYLHRSALWMGGDAKLFTLYSFLMPNLGYNNTLFPSVIKLFACSFITGTIILMPILIKDIIINYHNLANELFSPQRRQALYSAIATVNFTSWILFPFYYLAKITDPAIIFIIAYLIFHWGYRVKKEANKNYIIEDIKKNFIIGFIGILFGFLARLWLSPNSLSYQSLIRYIIMVGLSATISTCIHTTLRYFKNSHERIPFAPLLFMGCILSFAPFLTTLMNMVTQWNALQYH